MQHIPGIFFHKIDYSAKPPPPGPVDFEALGDYRDLTPEIVDPVIEYEIKKLMTKFRTEEEKFVDTNLRENPIIWYNRISSESSSPSSSSSSSSNSPKESPSNASKLQQISDCTRSKMLSKIKKAKFKLRYKFLMLKLEQNAATLQNLRNCIADAEANLRIHGRSSNELERLRKAMGVDRNRIENLPEINRMLFRAAEKALE